MMVTSVSAMASSITLTGFSHWQELLSAKAHHAPLAGFLKNIFVYAVRRQVQHWPKELLHIAVAAAVGEQNVLPRSFYADMDKGQPRILVRNPHVLYQSAIKEAFVEIAKKSLAFHFQ